ncbi:MAG: U32 family peptidase, partial [Parasporobacterium sp.]|nr:U32 family peptidase [Parasporobacterium sp.]
MLSCASCSHIKLNLYYLLNEVNNIMLNRKAVFVITYMNNTKCHMNNKIKKCFPEILAPAGTAEALRAAVSAGCDAVYLGGNMFSARAFAGNFGTEDLVDVIEYCHLFGVKVYMTVNTLLKEEELTALPGYISPFYEAGLDGVIVQDMGVVRVLMREFPDMPVHGSTQMSISSSYGAELLRQLGITRVVPARELSLDEIRSIINKVDIEIEAFVHGAMCYAYSGRCLFSSFMGGRSGNRGRCAQPCRQLYDVIRSGEAPDEDSRTPVKFSDNGDKRTLSGKCMEALGKYRQAGRSAAITREYAMSLKDMCTLEILPELIDAGIASFKIEGRMKNPSYVAGTVDAYRQARDYYLELLEEQAEENEKEEAGYVSSKEEAIEFRENSKAAYKSVVWAELSEKRKNKYLKLASKLTDDMKDIYNRGGFHTGYYHTEKGMVMTANKRPNHQGLTVGEVISVKGPDVNIKLIKAVNPQDVLEIIPAGVEITSNRHGNKGDVISLKGKELKKI